MFNWKQIYADINNTKPVPLHRVYKAHMHKPHCDIISNSEYIVAVVAFVCVLIGFIK